MSYGIQVFNSEGGVTLNSEYPLLRYMTGVIQKNSQGEVLVPSSANSDTRIGLLTALDILPNGRLASPVSFYGSSGELAKLRGRYRLYGFATVFNESNLDGLHASGLGGLNGAAFLSPAPPTLNTENGFGLNIFDGGGNPVFNTGSDLGGVVHTGVVNIRFTNDVTRTIEVGTFPNTLVCLGQLPEEIKPDWEQGGWKNYRAAGCGIKRIGDTYYMVSRLEDDYPTPRGPTDFTLQVPIVFLRKPR